MTPIEVDNDLILYTVYRFNDFVRPLWDIAKEYTNIDNLYHGHFCLEII